MIKIEYIDINEQVAIIAGYNNVGIIKNGNKSILIDSGLEDSSARKIYKIMKERGLTPTVIVNTHSHADHCGGNSYFQENHNVKIYASVQESIFVENTCLEPICFFSGSKPVRELENKFMQATPSKVTGIIKRGATLNINGIEINTISLPGHSIDQIGVEINGVLFCGDAFFSKHILDKYKLPFMIDEDNTLKSLRYLREDNYQIYIPSHGEATDDIKTVVDLNINKIEKIENDIKSLLKKENTTEELLQGVFNKYNINISSTQQYCLLKTTTMAYLSSLTNREVVKTGIKNNVLSWCLN